MCCNIPIEFKLQHMVELGFPEGWRFAFDDPQKMSLGVWDTIKGGSTASKRILALAGLKLFSPDEGNTQRGKGNCFHSLAHEHSQRHGHGGKVPGSCWIVSVCFISQSLFGWQKLLH